MFLKKDTRPNGRVYLSIVRGFRDPVTKKSKQKAVMKVGFLDELVNEYDDPIAYFENVAKEMTRKEKEDFLLLRFTFNQNELIPRDRTLRKNLGFAILSYYYHGLNINKFLINRQRNLKIEYSLNDILQCLVYQRILNPCSKKKTYESMDKFFFDYDFSLQDVYNSLSYFSKYRKDLLRFVHEEVTMGFGRDLSHTYYDVINYYFEISDEDEFRRRGVCKEHRPKPIVQMGLFIDNDGIPVTYRLFRDNTSDCDTYLPILDEIKTEFNVGHTIVVADKGMTTVENIPYNLIKKDGYIFSQTVRGASQEMKEFVLSENDYVYIGDEGFKMKSCIVRTKIWVVNDQNKRIQVEIDQKQIAFYSPDYDRKAKHERAKVLEKSQGLLSKNKHARTTGPYEYLSKERVDLDTGEVTKTKDHYCIDMEKVSEEEQYDGYYLIVTSELNMPDGKVIDTYRGLWEIEESFKITKSESQSRPAFVKLKDHLDAHFLTCFLSLLILRLLERDMEKITSGKEISSLRTMVESMRNYQGTYLNQNYYMFDFNDEMTDLFGEILGFPLNKRFMGTQEIKNIIARSKKGYRTT